MYIKRLIRIKNYRNLSNVVFEFAHDINFVVGENNIGKTNLIELLTGIFRMSKFYEEDFYDIKEPIEVVFEIEYAKGELSFFKNTFGEKDQSTLTITAIQEDVDARIEYYHTGSGLAINPRKIKMFNFIYYSSLRSPSKEYSLSKNREKEKKINRLLEIEADMGEKILALGDGVPYAYDVFLSILELLLHLQTTKKDEEYESLLIRNEEGEKYLPLILGLDEPENHQHPYRQRAVIKAIRKMIDNENKDFLKIVKELFDIDGFIGQVFVITHSPNILLDDYKQIVRVYIHENNVAARCGSVLNFEQNVYKHLRRSFIYFKEAMFAKSVILVEGDTEFGAVPIFAKRLGYDLDDEGIGIVKLDGADGVRKYLKLFKAFKIEAIAILDKDKMMTYVGDPDIRFTMGQDFEEEIFDVFSFDQYLKFLSNTGRHTRLMAALKDQVEGFDPGEFSKDPRALKIPEEVAKKIMLDVRDNEIQHLRSIKNVVNGALVASYCDKVPESFRTIIEEAIRDGL